MYQVLGKNKWFDSYIAKYINKFRTYNYFDYRTNEKNY